MHVVVGLVRASAMHTEALVPDVAELLDLSHFAYPPVSPTQASATLNSFKMRASPGALRSSSDPVRVESFEIARSKTATFVSPFNRDG